MNSITVCGIDTEFDDSIYIYIYVYTVICIYMHVCMSINLCMLTYKPTHYNNNEFY